MGFGDEPFQKPEEDYYKKTNPVWQPISVLEDFVVMVDERSEEDRARYDALMEDLKRVDRYGAVSTDWLRHNEWTQRTEFQSLSAESIASNSGEYVLDQLSGPMTADLAEWLYKDYWVLLYVTVPMIQEQCRLWLEIDKLGQRSYPSEREYLQIKWVQRESLVIEYYADMIMKHAILMLRDLL